ncbi:MAG: IS3 family transposase [Clostridia bacterium]|jgi:transposase InsO family protein|nr:IS3 family transposase [uncultured Ruminococcus sp.]MBQ1389295.1 IS3 family transposase [Clostridia bacterium]MBQ2427810.1 IS3 family transposase [Ruminococcus sp.]
MIFIDSKTDGGKIKGKLALYCRLMEVSRQGFYDYLHTKDKPYKYASLVKAIKEIIEEDEYNDTYGRIRMYQALKLKQPKGVKIPCRATVRKVMKENHLTVPTRRKPNGITKADREAQKSDNKIKRNFTADKPFAKGVTDITEIPAKNGKLYVSAIFDCYDSEVVGLSMDDNMKAELCVRTLSSAVKMHPQMRGAIVHSDRGSQYTSAKYRSAVAENGIIQSMNSAGGRCHDNARCESMWARMKEEMFYRRNRKPENYSVEELKSMVWYYFISYWNNRRICSANDGLPPTVKRKQYYSNLMNAA